MNSIRRTAFIWLSLLLLFIGIVTTATSYLLATRQTDILLDNQLRQIAHYIGESPPGDIRPSPSSPSYEAEENFIVQIWFAGDEAPRSSNPGMPIPRQGKPGFTEARAADKTWRTYTDLEAERTVQVSQRLDVRHELSNDAALRAAAPIVILIPLSWLLLGFVIDRSIRRLDRLAANVAARPLVSSEPIPMDVPRELAPFVKAINDLILRLQASNQRQRQFVSDAAHELRTPLAALKLQIGNVRNIANTRALKERLAEVDQGVSRASGLVQQLLKLARSDAEAPGAPPERVNIAVVFRDCIAAISPLAQSRGTTLNVEANGMPKVETATGDLKVLIANLLDNAVRHSPEGSKVELSATLRHASIVVAIKDEGPGIPEPLLEKVFERFYRAADQQVEGSGLGLAIARSIAERQGYKLSLRNRDQNSGLIAEFEIPLPRAGQSERCANS